MNKKQYIWRHNSFLGHVAMAKQAMENMCRSPSLTPEAKLLALEAHVALLRLYAALKTRVD